MECLDTWADCGPRWRRVILRALVEKTGEGCVKPSYIARSVSIGSGKWTCSRTRRSEDREVVRDGRESCSSKS